MKKLIMMRTNSTSRVLTATPGPATPAPSNLANGPQKKVVNVGKK